MNSTRTAHDHPHAAPRTSPATCSRFVSSLCIGAAVLTFLSGCQTARLNEPVRAIWVTRSDYRSPADVTTILDNCRDAGFNTVLFQVRGNGTAFYASKLEPWADELGGRDPGWDPLALACREAHARGLALHAWVNVMPAWQGRRPPDNPEQLYNKHPDWFWYDAAGQRQPLVHTVGDDDRAWYVSVNPCLPAVRDYLVEVFRDLAARYDIDGLHMDYIRFPNEPVIRGEQIPDYPRDPRTLELFHQATGRTPDDDPEAWNQWRTEQVTLLVSEIRDMLRRTRPDAALTAAVGPLRENALRHFQDGRTWMRERLVDGLFLMNYTDDPEQFQKRLEPWLAEHADQPGAGDDRVVLVPGLWFGRHPGKTPEEAAAAVRAQIDLARSNLGNFCVFSYAGLFEPAGQPREGRRSDEQRATRQARRDVLLPYIREAAQSDR